jgi:uncharacterized protein HemX
MSGRHHKTQKKQKTSPRIAVPENSATAVETTTEPNAENKNVMGNRQPTFKPPDSPVAVWTLAVGIVIAAIYFFQLQAMRQQLTVCMANWIPC